MAFPLAVTNEILYFLQFQPEPPSITFLDDLLTAYTQHVPWESAFRIAKRAATPETASCPRWPAEFGKDAMERGGGGTCFESNYAFFWLLQKLGFDGYLTVNDRGESRSCHTAIVIRLGDRLGDTLGSERWLVDVGYPLYLAVPLRTEQTPHRSWNPSPRWAIHSRPHSNRCLSQTRRNVWPACSGWIGTFCRPLLAVWPRSHLRKNRVETQHGFCYTRRI